MKEEDTIVDTLRSLGIEKSRKRIKSDRRKIVYARDREKCRYCGKKVEYHLFHLDHVLPRYHWGNDYVFNLVVSCPECNMKKGANKNIVPEPLGIIDRLYELYLIIKFKDFPEVGDFI